MAGRTPKKVYCNEEYPDFRTGSPCPHCHSTDGMYEIGASDKAGKLSVRLTCANCGRVHKQNVPDPNYDPDEVITIQGC